MQTNDDARLRLSGGELSEGPNPDHSLNHKQSQWYKQLTRQVAYGLEASFLDAFHQIQTVSTPLARDVHLTLNACKHQSPKTNGRENHRLLVSANGQSRLCKPHRCPIEDHLGEGGGGWNALWVLAASVACWHAA